MNIQNLQSEIEKLVKEIPNTGHRTFISNLDKLYSSFDQELERNRMSVNNLGQGEYRMLFHLHYSTLLIEAMCQCGKNKDKAYKVIMPLFLLKELRGGLERKNKKPIDYDNVTFKGVPIISGIFDYVAIVGEKDIYKIKIQNHES